MNTIRKHVRHQLCSDCHNVFDADDLHPVPDDDRGAICDDCARKRKGKQ